MKLLLFSETEKIFEDSDEENKKYQKKFDNEYDFIEKNIISKRTNSKEKLSTIKSNNSLSKIEELS